MDSNPAADIVTNTDTGYGQQMRADSNVLTVFGCPTNARMLWLNVVKRHLDTLTKPCITTEKVAGKEIDIRSKSTYVIVGILSGFVRSRWASPSHQTQVINA